MSDKSLVKRSRDPRPILGVPGCHRPQKAEADKQDNSPS